MQFVFKQSLQMPPRIQTSQTHSYGSLKVTGKSKLLSIEASTYF